MQRCWPSFLSYPDHWFGSAVFRWFSSQETRQAFIEETNEELRGKIGRWEVQLQNINTALAEATRSYEDAFNEHESYNNADTSTAYEFCKSKYNRTMEQKDRITRKLQQLTAQYDQRLKMIAAKETAEEAERFEKQEYAVGLRVQDVTKHMEKQGERVSKLSAKHAEFVEVSKKVENAETLIDDDEQLLKSHHRSRVAINNESPIELQFRQNRQLRQLEAENQQNAALQRQLDTKRQTLTATVTQEKGEGDEEGGEVDVEIVAPKNNKSDRARVRDRAAELFLE